jgi:hypothetical protein
MKKPDLERAVEMLERGDWQAAHQIVQEDSSPISCWAHGIVHMLEGDTSNARYWYRQAKRPFPREASAAKEIESLRKELSRTPAHR